MRVNYKAILTISFFIILVLPMLAASNQINVETGDSSFNVTIKVEGFDDVIPGAFVELLTESTGSIVASGFTNSSGQINFDNVDNSTNYTLKVARDGKYLNDSFLATGFNFKKVDSINITETPAVKIKLNFMNNYTVGVAFDNFFNNSVYIDSPGLLDINFTIWGNQTDEYNVSVFIAHNDSGFTEIYSHDLLRGIYNVSLDFTDVGNYSFYVRANHSDEINTSGIYRLFVDNVDPSYHNLHLIPGPEQNATQYVNLSVHLNSTYSYLTNISFFVNDELKKQNETIGDYFISGKNFEWGYELPFESIGETISLHYCFRDASYSFTNETCTEPQFVSVVYNIPPNIDDYSIASQSIRTDGFFEISVNSDSNTEFLRVNVSLYNGTYPLNLSVDSPQYGNTYILEHDFSLSSISENNYTVIIMAEDEFGNIQSNDTWLEIINLPPYISNFSVGNNFFRSDDYLELYLNALGAYNEDIEVNGTLFDGSNDIFNFSFLSSDIDNFNGSFIFTYNFSLEPIGEGNYTLNVTARGDFDKISLIESWIIIDDTPPEVQSVNLSHTLARGTGTTGEGQEITINATIFDDYMHNPDEIIVKGIVTSNSSNFNDTFNFSHLFSDVWQANYIVGYDGDGNITFNITAIDYAGNIGFNDTQELEVDSTAIDVTIDSPIPGVIYNGLHGIDLNLTFNLSEEPSSLYYEILGLPKYSIPIAGQHFSLNISSNFTYPGSYFLRLEVFDEVGNPSFPGLHIFANFLLNITSWIDDFEETNDNRFSLSIHNKSDNSNFADFDNYLNLTDLNAVLSFNFNDGKNFNASTNLLYSYLNRYNEIELEYFNSDFNNSYIEHHGAAVIDKFRFIGLDLLNINNFSLKFNYDSSEFEKIYYCKNDFLFCDDIEPFNPSQNQTLFYYDDAGVTFVNNSLNLWELGFDRTFSFILVNDTIPPIIGFESTSTEFDDIYSESINISLNEYAYCEYNFYDSSQLPYFTFDNLPLSDFVEVNFSGYSKFYHYNFTFPSYSYENGTHTLELVCTDLADNEKIKQFEFNVTGEPAPPINDIWPPDGTLFQYNRESVELSLNTAPHAVSCVVTDSFNSSIGGSMISSFGIDHSYEITGLSPGESLEYLVNCTNNFGNSTTELFSFDIRNPPSNATDSSTGATVPIQSDDSDTSETEEDDEEDDDVEDDFYFSETFDFSTIIYGEEIKINVTNLEIPIASVKFSSNKNISDLSFKLESFTSNDFFDSSSVLPISNLYRYVQIKEENNIDFSELSNFTLEFRVDVSWMEDNFLTDDDLLINYYNDNTNEWIELSKTHIADRENFRVYLVESRPAKLYAISILEKPSPSGGTLPMQDDDMFPEEDILEAGFLNISSIIMHISLIVTIVFVSAAIYGNKNTIAKYYEMRRKQKIDEHIKVRKREKNIKDDSSDLRNQTTRDYSKNNYGFHDKIKELVVPSQKVDIPREDVLINYLEILYRNAWIKGYNDKFIMKSLEKEGWPKEMILESLSYLKVDIDAKKYTISDSDMKRLVDRLQSLIISKYGIPKSILFATLKSKGWPTYMIKSAMDNLSSSMNTPVYGEINFSEMIAMGGYEDYDTSELEIYIKDSLDDGIKHSTIIKNTTKVGWPNELVNELLSKYNN